MAKVTFTPAQRQAIDAPQGNLLVSAAAGSGKTAVLTERVIRLLSGDDPVFADRLIIVTFTVLASVEMRQRIEKKLSELIEQSPENELLQTQQLLLQSAKISTIHSLCTALVKENFQVLGLPANFRVAEGNELSVLQKEVLDEVIETFYEESDREFLDLLDSLLEKNDRRLPELVNGVYQFIRSYPFPESYLDRFLAFYQNDQPFLETDWGQEVLNYLIPSLEKADRLFSRALEMAASDKQVREKYGPAIENDRDTVQLLVRQLGDRNWDDACLSIRAYDKRRLDSVSKFEDKALLASIKKAREEACDILFELKQRYLVTTEREMREDMDILYRQSKALFALVRRYDEELTKQKLERGIIDFSDLEHYTLKLLVEFDGAYYHKTRTALALNKQYDEIMIDECQDINTIQNLIFWALSDGEEKVKAGSDALLTGSRNLFMVGDVKQSIYRFRNAMPSLFSLRKKLFPLYEPDTEEPAKILLQNNFRSRREVTDSINRIFSRIMTEEMGEILYDKEERLVPSAVYEEADGCETELHLVELEHEEEEGDFDGEAEYVARLIERMVQERYPVQDHGELRPCRYRDFCVLLRAKKEKTQRYVNAFEEAGVPCYADKSNGYFDSFEIGVMLNLLRVIDNPLLDIPLFSVLISPMFLFTPDEIVAIRLKDRTGSLYTALRAAAEQGDRKCTDCLAVLSFLREQAVMLPVEQLIQTIYDRTGFLYVVESMASGEQKRANLRLLLSYGESYEQMGSQGLEGFIRYIDRAIERGEDFTCANTVSETADVVRIMSIHNSKGLEFPICIVSDLAKPFNLQDLSKPFLLHAEYGFGMKIRKPEMQQEYGNVPMESIRLSVKRETLSEEMRVLYVALTRAREKLIMVGSGKNIRRKLCDMTQEIHLDGGVTPYGLMQMNSYLSWVAASLADNQVFLEALGSGIEEADADGIRCIFRASGQKEEKNEKELVFNASPDETILDTLRRSLGYEYPRRTRSRLPAKVTVTQIAKQKTADMVQEIEPLTLTEADNPTGARRGTILHSFMQYADFKQAKRDLESEIERLISQNFMNERDTKFLNRNTILAFLDSDLAERMMHARNLYREYSFLCEVSASDIEKDIDEETGREKIMIQGMADVVMAEPDGLVIIDYKNDRLPDGKSFLERYQRQIEIYRQAVQKYFKLPVKKCIIYSLQLGQEIPVPTEKTEKK